MRVRFLVTVASSAPEHPFQAGQILHLSRLTSEIRDLIRDGKAEVLDDDAPEAAVLGDAPEQTREPRPKARGSRA